MRTKRPKVFIHLGHQKCGSKSIQLFLRDHRDTLEAQGFYSPRATKVVDYDMGLGAFSGNPGHTSEFVLVNDVAPSDAEHLDDLIEEKLLNEIHEKQPENIVFSFEGLMNQPKAAVHKLSGLLRKISDDIRVLAIIRRQDRWSVSAYTTKLVHNGFTGKDVLRSKNNIYSAERYFECLSTWRKAASPTSMTVVAFEDMADAVDVFQRFIGVKIDDKSRRANQTISAYGQEILRQFNAALPDHPRWAKHQAEIRHAIVPLLPKGEPKLPSRQAVDELLEYYAEDNRKLVGSYLSADSAYFAEQLDYPEEAAPTVVRHNEVEDWVDLAFSKL